MCMNDIFTPIFEYFKDISIIPIKASGHNTTSYPIAILPHSNICNDQPSLLWSIGKCRDID